MVSNILIYTLIMSYWLRVLLRKKYINSDNSSETSFKIYSLFQASRLILIIGIILQHISILYKLDKKNQFDPFWINAEIRRLPVLQNFLYLLCKTQHHQPNDFFFIEKLNVIFILKDHY